jgi:hypothetical protein
MRSIQLTWFSFNWYCLPLVFLSTSKHTEERSKAITDCLSVASRILYAVIYITIDSSFLCFLPHVLKFLLIIDYPCVAEYHFLWLFQELLTLTTRLVFFHNILLNAVLHSHTVLILLNINLVHLLWILRVKCWNSWSVQYWFLIWMIHNASSNASNHMFSKMAQVEQLMRPIHVSDSEQWLSVNYVFFKVMLETFSAYSVSEVTSKSFANARYS